MTNRDLEAIDAQQLNLDLFGLDPLRDRKYSNTLEVYDLAGKYLYDKHTKYRVAASAEEMEIRRVTTYRGTELQISVTAANIERISDGRKQRTFVFPGAREETVEDVLRKLATARRAQAYEATSGTAYSGARFVGITFTLYEVYEELHRVGKSYSYREIKEALRIMNRAILTIQSENRSIDLSAPFFPIMAIAEHGGARDTRSFVCFHPMVTTAILTRNYRRYDYTKALSLSGHYTRLIYKRLCLRWVQAAPDSPYTILLTTLVRSTKAPYPHLYKDKELFQGVMDELRREDVLDRYTMTPKKQGKKIVDWRFDLYATEAFAKQQASNNKVAARTRGAQYVALADPG